MTYQEAVDYILKIPKFAKKNKPEHTKTFLELLGRPQDKMKVLHVAGTNGKGSVCAYFNAMLLSEGKTVGLFTSPHLVKINERIAVNGQPVSDERFLEAFYRTLHQVRTMEADGLPHPTFFEFLFGMALSVFAEEGVEYAVLETGMGGRLDATNAVERPLATVITSIGYDHREYLGDTLEKIAFEKAGIIKERVPVFYTEGREETNRVIEEQAKKCHSLCKKIGKDAYEILGIEEKRIAFSCSNAYYGNTTWKLHNIGIYQPENAMLAMETMRFLFADMGHPKRWRQALLQVNWAGRMEEVLPGIYVDGAHNVNAIEAFIESVPQKERTILVFSAVKDKDYEEMIRLLCQKMSADLYIVTSIENSRGVAADRLREIFQKYTQQPVMIKNTAAQAVCYARDHREGRIAYCVGSLYLAGEIKKWIQEVQDAEL